MRLHHTRNYGDRSPYLCQWLTSEVSDDTMDQCGLSYFWRSHNSYHNWWRFEWCSINQWYVLLLGLNVLASVKKNYKSMRKGKTEARPTINYYLYAYLLKRRSVLIVELRANALGLRSLSGLSRNFTLPSSGLSGLAPFVLFFFLSALRPANFKRKY